MHFCRRSRGDGLDVWIRILGCTAGVCVNLCAQAGTVSLCEASVCLYLLYHSRTGHELSFLCQKQMQHLYTVCQRPFCSHFIIQQMEFDTSVAWVNHVMINRRAGRKEGMVMEFKLERLNQSACPAIGDLKPAAVLSLYPTYVRILAGYTRCFFSADMLWSVSGVGGRMRHWVICDFEWK